MHEQFPALTPFAVIESTGDGARGGEQGGRIHPSGDGEGLVFVEVRHVAEFDAGVGVQNGRWSCAPAVAPFEGFFGCGLWFEHTVAEGDPGHQRVLSNVGLLRLRYFQPFLHGRLRFGAALLEGGTRFFDESG